MSQSAVPKPLSAYVGLLMASFEDARGAGRSPIAQAVRLPLATAGQLLTARARYDELAEQGEVVVDVVVGGVLSVLRSRFGTAADDLSEAADDAAEWLMDTADSAAETVRERAGYAASAAADITERAVASVNGAAPLDDLLDEDEDEGADPLAADADVLTDEDVEAAVDAATHAPASSETPAAAPTPLQDLESFAVSPEVSRAAGGLKDASDLPIEDFDHMTLPQLRGRLRRLDAVQLTQLLDYERAHANRVGILTLLENRLRKLDAEGPTDVPLI